MPGKTWDLWNRWFRWTLVVGWIGVIGCRPPWANSPGIVELDRGGEHVSWEAGKAWMQDSNQAFARARAEQKLVLAFFTGSDFCAPCAQLKREVFEAPEFNEWSQHRFVLLELDSPRATPQPAEIASQVRNLRQQYGVESFPTVLILDADGQELGRLNGQPRGFSAWTRTVEEKVGL